jgi:hypothetical protein
MLGDMDAPRQIAIIADEYELVAVMRARLDELNVSRREWSRQSGLTESLGEKLLAMPQIRYFGRNSFWNGLQAMGYVVIIAEDPHATKRFADRMPKRTMPKRGHGIRSTEWLKRSGRIPWLFTPERARELLMLTNVSLGSEGRIERARKAAKARWGHLPVQAVTAAATPAPGRSRSAP